MWDISLQYFMYANSYVYNPLFSFMYDQYRMQLNYSDTLIYCSHTSFTGFRILRHVGG
jgi:hypothetical protein